MTPSSIENKFRDYLKMYDGIPKELGELETKHTDSLFHDVVIIGDSGNITVTKSALLERIETYLKAGRKIALLELKIDDNTLTWKVHITGPWTGPFGINKVEHTRATVKDGKVCQIKAVQDRETINYKVAQSSGAVNASFAVTA